MKLVTAVFWFSVAMLVWILVRSYGELPETVASSFAGNGQAQGYMTKQQFLILQTAMMGMVVLLFAFLPPLLLRMPESLINMPKKTYWLAPERRAASRALLGDQLLWMGAATVLFMVYVLHLVIEANLSPVPRLDAGFGWALGLYLVAVFGWCAWLIRHFNRVPA